MKLFPVFLLICLLTACSKPDPDFCEVDYHIYFKKNGVQLCLKNNELLLEHYNADSIRVFELKPIGVYQKFVKYYYNKDSCLFLFPQTFSPITIFTIGAGSGMQDTLSFIKNAKNVKYYLNGKYQYEIKDACKKRNVECIIEI